MHQFFYNASGDFALDLIATFRAVGLPRHAETLERSVALFAPSYPAENSVRRAQFFSKTWSDWDEKLNAATDDIDDGAIRDKMLEIAKQGGVLPQ